MQQKTEDPEQETTRTPQAQTDPEICLVYPSISLRAGITCPRCQAGTIDYDSMLHLVCPSCGLTEAGVCT